MKEFNEKEQEIIKACASNHWLSDWEEYPSYDYDYGFREVHSQEELMEVFLEGNWSIRSGVIFGDLAFVQQVNGGDEWLTMKHEEGRYKVFESISFQPMLQNRGEQGFVEYLNKLQVETVDQYWGREPEVSQEQNTQHELADCLKVAEKIYDAHYYKEHNLSSEDFSVTELTSRESLQKFFQNTQGTLGTMAVHGDFLFIKEEAGQDLWLALTKEDGQYQSAYTYPMKEIAQSKETFDTVMTEIEQISHEMCQGSFEENLSEHDEEALKISVLKVEVGKEPYVKEINDDLKSLQAEVGGLIQVVYLEDDLEGPQMIVNEEGKINGMEMNRRMPNDIICGDFFICQADEDGELVSLSSENIQKYSEMFQEVPEFSDHEPDAEPRITVIGFNY